MTDKAGETIREKSVELLRMLSDDGEHIRQTWPWPLDLIGEVFAELAAERAKVETLNIGRKILESDLASAQAEFKALTGTTLAEYHQTLDDLLAEQAQVRRLEDQVKVLRVTLAATEEILEHDYPATLRGVREVLAATEPKGEKAV